MPHTRYLVIVWLMSMPIVQSIRLESFKKLQHARVLRFDVSF